MLELNKAYNMDCVEGMRLLDSGSVEGSAGSSTVISAKNGPGGVLGRLTDAAAVTWRSTAQRSLNGTQRREKNISRNFLESAKNRSYGAGITFIFHLTDVSLYGRKQIFPKTSQWRLRSMPDAVSMITQRL